jgi:hypothetical protein
MYCSKCRERKHYYVELKSVRYTVHVYRDIWWHDTVEEVKDEQSVETDTSVERYCPDCNTILIPM